MDDAEGGEDSMEFSEVRSSNKRVRDLSVDRACSEGKKPRQVNTRSNSGTHSVVICSIGGLPITAWNNIKLGQAIQQAIGNIKQVKRQGAKELLIICTGPAQVKKALALTSIMGRDVQCRQQLAANQTRGVIYGIGDELTEEEVLVALKKNKCYKVERLYKGREKMKTKCMLLYFDLEDIPTEICLGYEMFEVKPYVPPVLRCYKCQGYGHISSSCRGKQRCPRCAGEHEFEQCRNLDRPKCVNCGSLGHSSAYLGCPYRKQVSKAQYIKVTQKVSFAEALKNVREENRRPYPESPTERALLEGSEYSPSMCNSTPPTYNGTPPLPDVHPVKPTSQFKRVKPVMKSAFTQTISDSGNQTEELSLSTATKIIAVFTEVMLKAFELREVDQFIAEVFHITQSRLGPEHVNFTRLKSVLSSLVSAEVS